MIILRDSATITDKKVWEIYTKIKSENIQYQELENYYLQWYKLRQEDKNPEKLAIRKSLPLF